MRTSAFERLCDLPQDILEKFWKNFENDVKKKDNVMDKLKFVDTVFNRPSASEIILNAFFWCDTPEGHEYWGTLVDSLNKSEKKLHPFS
jgi:hypothetical protein